MQCQQMSGRTLGVELQHGAGIEARYPAFRQEVSRVRLVHAYPYVGHLHRRTPLRSQTLDLVYQTRDALL